MRKKNTRRVFVVAPFSIYFRSNEIISIDFALDGFFQSKFHLRYNQEAAKFFFVFFLALQFRIHIEKPLTISHVKLLLSFNGRKKKFNLLFLFCQTMNGRK